MGQRYHRMKNQKPGLACNQDIAEGGGLEQRVGAGDYRGLGAKLPATGRFLKIL